MPAAGFPNNLQLLLDTMMEHRSIKSWQIYDERGGMTVKIRFAPSESEHDNNDCVNGYSCAYTKKSVSKMKRDKTRMDNFTSPRTTRSMTKRNETSVEKPRNDESGELNNVAIFSPDHVDPLPPPNNNNSMDLSLVSSQSIEDNI